jgi:hypothetical protein
MQEYPSNIKDTGKTMQVKTELNDDPGAFGVWTLKGTFFLKRYRDGASRTERPARVILLRSCG